MPTDETPPLFFEDVAVGDEAPTVSVGPITRQDFVRYAGASGDFNPIHYDDEYAQEAGNPEIFGQGMFTAGVLSSMVYDWVGLAAVRSFSTRFDNPLWPGETINASGIVVERDPTVGDVSADLEVVTNDDTTVLTGSMTARLPRQN